MDLVEKNIGIIKIIEYLYVNNLYDKYSSIILKNNEKFLELSYTIVDFCIYDE